ncbi:MAG: MFS transporter [bacterium]
MINPFWLLLFLTVVINMGVGLIIPVMPIFLKEFGFSTGHLSVAFFALVFARFIAQNVGGRLILKFGYYKVLGISFCLYVITMGLYPFVFTKDIFICFRFLEGIFEGFAVVCLTDLSIELSNNKDRAKKMGYFSAAFGLGFILGPSIGGLMFQGYGKYGMFWSAGLLGAIGLIGLLIAHKALNLKHEEKTTSRNFFVNFNKESLSLLPFYGPYILRRVLFFSLQLLLPLYLHEYFHVSPGKVGIYFSISAILTTALMPFTGRVADIFSCKKIIIMCLLIMGGSIASFGFMPKQSFFLTVFILETLAFAFMLPTGMKIFGDVISSNSNRGQILGFFGSLTDICTIIIPFIILPLYDIMAKLPWIFLGGLCVLASIPFWKVPVLNYANNN